MVTEDYLDKNFCKLDDIKGRRIDAPRNSAGEKSSVGCANGNLSGLKREIYGKLPDGQGGEGKVKGAKRSVYRNEKFEMFKKEQKDAPLARPGKGGGTEYHFWKAADSPMKIFDRS